MANKNEALGTRRAHYSPAKDGPFECHACIHFHLPHMCVHPEVIADAKARQPNLSLTSKGLAIVEAGGCCEYQRSH